MSLPSPNLDDRDFNQLMNEARLRISQSSPGWTDLSPGDPGIVLLDLFAYLTETMIYRINRVPDKMYITFLQLIGIQLQPPAAASTSLVFSRARADNQAIQIPRGTRVALSRAGSSDDSLFFTTSADATIAAGATQTEVLAYQCDLVEGELVGTGTGLAGQTVNVLRPPIVAPTGDNLDLVVGIEASADELSERIPAISYGGKSYRVWREVENFTNLGDDLYVYLADRMSGTLLFAPSARLALSDGTLQPTPQALAEVPPVGREIRIWYRRGGGSDGNVEANTLTKLKDAINGVQVTNPNPALGGREPETVDNAKVRGPQQLHSLQRAVTARDFELVALEGSKAVARTKALTRADLWSYATPGTVEVLLVPYLPEDQRGSGQVTVSVLQQHQTQEVLAAIQQLLDERRPLGTTCLVNWAHYKMVSVAVRIVVRREEDQQAVKDRVNERLYQSINPLPTQFSSSGWPFGQALRASHVYDIALAEPGVRWVDQVTLRVEEVPESNVTTICADATQLQTWYVGSGGVLFRSLNDGDGWEPAGRFDGEAITTVEGHPGRAGLLAVATSLPNAAGSRLHISWDCAETWDTTVYSLAFQVQDLGWTLRNGVPVLLMATSVGLYELTIQPGGSPVQVLVDQTQQSLGFYAISVSTDVRGVVNVAVAAQNTSGVYLSSSGGASNTFRMAGLKGQDVRVLTTERDGPRLFLWAGTASAGGDDPGNGCFTRELLGSQDPTEGWQAFGTSWNGGTCHSIIFVGSNVMVASHRAGVLQLDLHARTSAWQASNVGCGLPLRDPGRFQPALTMATNQQANIVIEGGVKGAFRSKDGGKSYISLSNKEFSDKVTLPATWLFVSGDHDITVVSEDEAD